MPSFPQGHSNRAFKLNNITRAKHEKRFMHFYLVYDTHYKRGQTLFTTSVPFLASIAPGLSTRVTAVIS